MKKFEARNVDFADSKAGRIRRQARRNRQFERNATFDANR